MATPTQIADFRARGEAAGWPLISFHDKGMHFQGEERWQRLLNPDRELSQLGYVQELESQLARAEAAQRLRASYAAPERIRDASPLRDDEPEAIAFRAMVDEGTRAAEYRASTPGRLEVIEELLREIRDGLATRR